VCSCKNSLKYALIAELHGDFANQPELRSLSPTAANNSSTHNFRPLNELSSSLILFVFGLFFVN